MSGWNGKCKTKKKKVGRLRRWKDWVRFARAWDYFWWQIRWRLWQQNRKAVHRHPLCRSGCVFHLRDCFSVLRFCRLWRQNGGKSTSLMRLLFGQFFLSFRLRCVTVRGQHWKRFWNAWSMTIWPLLFCYLDFSALPVISRCPVTWQVLRVSMWDYWHWEPCFQAGSVRPVPVCWWFVRLSRWMHGERRNVISLSSLFSLYPTSVTRLCWWASCAAYRSSGAYIWRRSYSSICWCCWQSSISLIRGHIVRISRAVWNRISANRVPK